MIVGEKWISGNWSFHIRSFSCLVTPVMHFNAIVDDWPWSNGQLTAHRGGTSGTSWLNETRRPTIVDRKLWSPSIPKIDPWHDSMLANHRLNAYNVCVCCFNELEKIYRVTESNLDGIEKKLSLETIVHNHFLSKVTALSKFFYIRKTNPRESFLEVARFN